MRAHRSDTFILTIVLLCDAVIIVLAVCNIVAKLGAAQLPAEYRSPLLTMEFHPANADSVYTVRSLDGQRITSPDLLPYILSLYSQGDSVRITAFRDGRTVRRIIRLVPRYSGLDIASSTGIGLIFLLFGIYTIRRREREAFAAVLTALMVGTAIMVLYGWGTTTLLPRTINLLLRLLFDCAVWLLPSLFFHFSFIFPKRTPKAKRLFLIPWYVASIAGIVCSVWYLVALFFYSIPVHETFYAQLHGTVNDIFGITGLLCAVGNLEHSALTIRDANDRKKIYWVLLGVIFGPLVFVFLILVPRIFLGHELVGYSLMQYTMLMAPLMLWKALR